MTNSELRRLSRERLRSHWNQPIIITLLTLIISLIVQFVTEYQYFVGFIISILISPVQYGVLVFFLKFIREEEVSIELLFDGYKDFFRILTAQVLISIFTLLWTLLFIIPGIVKSYSYSMTLYILYDNPDMSALDAITLSRKMMDGRKKDLFLLELSFVGWFILSVFTFGILLLWIIPYMNTSISYFYEETKKKYEAKNVFS